MKFQAVNDFVDDLSLGAESQANKLEIAARRSFDAGECQIANCGTTASCRMRCSPAAGLIC